MAEQILKQSLSSPGFFGLNLQSADEYSDFRFAKEATNVVFDASGRIAARKGWTPISASFGNVSEAGASEYNIAEYNIAEYSSGIVIDDTTVAVGGQGKIIQMGFEAQVSGSPLSVQKMDIFIKQGKTY